MNHPSRDSTLQDWIDWLLALHTQEIDLGLERVAQVADRLKVSRPAPFVISVAGTNGKGSSVAMLSSTLDASGYRVGTYTSPHILRFNERIQLNGKPVDDQIIIDAFLEIELSRGDVKLTYFEFSTLAALLIFKQHRVEVAVLEVGLGGRLDAVNLVDADAALITAIDVDHIDWLGSDRSVIAIEKAGITRVGKPAVCSDSNPPQSLFDYAHKHQIALVSLNRDFSFSQNEQACQDSTKGAKWSVSFNSNVATFHWPEVSKRPLPLPALKGQFQLQNAAGVIALLASVQATLPVSYSALCKGLETASHPGRLQPLLVNEQAWLIDVAHNPQSAQVLAGYLAEQNAVNHYQAVFSVLNDKDSLPMVTLLKPYIQTWFIADLAIARSTSLAELSNLLLQAGVAEVDIRPMPSIDKALEGVVQDPQKPVLVWGSFFTVSQALAGLNKRDWLL